MHLQDHALAAGLVDDDALGLLTLLATLAGDVHQLKALQDTRAGWHRKRKGCAGTAVGGPHLSGHGVLTRLQEVLQGTWVQEMTLSCVALSLRSVHVQFWHLEEKTGEPGFGHGEGR